MIGHTDRVGSVQFNDALSLRRAQKIRDDLVQLGVVAEQIQVAGRGEARAARPHRGRDRRAAESPRRDQRALSARLTGHSTGG